MRIIVIMGNKRNIQGEHKEKKKPNLLKLVIQKRNKLIDIYQKIYIQQTGLSIRDPRYNRKAGSDRVKALERGWPKPWNQLIPLFDTAIGDANLELGQGVLAAGAAAVGVAPVEPAEVRDVDAADAAAAVEAVEAVVRDNDTVCDDQPEVEPVSMIVDYSDDAVVAAQVAATRAAIAAASGEPVDVRDGAVGDVEPVPMDVDEPGASPEAGEVYMDVDESLELLPHPRDVLNAVRAAPGADEMRTADKEAAGDLTVRGRVEVSDVGGSDNLEGKGILPANSTSAVGSSAVIDNICASVAVEPRTKIKENIVDPSNYQDDAQWALQSLERQFLNDQAKQALEVVELNHGEVVEYLGDVTNVIIRLGATGPAPLPPPSPVSNTSIRPDVTGPTPPPPSPSSQPPSLVSQLPNNVPPMIFQNN